MNASEVHDGDFVPVSVDDLLDCMRVAIAVLELPDSIGPYTLERRFGWRDRFGHFMAFVLKLPDGRKAYLLGSYCTQCMFLSDCPAFTVHTYIADSDFDLPLPAIIGHTRVVWQQGDLS